MEPFAENAEDKREEIKSKLRQCFDGKIVRKDLTKKINLNSPPYLVTTFNPLNRLLCHS